MAIPYKQILTDSYNKFLIKFLYVYYYILYVVDRSNKDDVEKELNEGIGYVEKYTQALQREIVAREALLALLASATQYYSTQRGEVKVVAYVSLLELLFLCSLNEVPPKCTCVLPLPLILYLQKKKGKNRKTRNLITTPLASLV